MADHHILGLDIEAIPLSGRKKRRYRPAPMFADSTQSVPDNLLPKWMLWLSQQGQPECPSMSLWQHWGPVVIGCDEVNGGCLRSSLAKSSTSG